VDGSARGRADGPFETSAGAAACPYSDARASTRAGPKEDVVAIEVSPVGTATDAARVRGAHVSREVDGTVNDAGTWTKNG
jgi:hypothetical protein